MYICTYGMYSMYVFNAFNLFTCSSASSRSMCKHIILASLFYVFEYWRSHNVYCMYVCMLACMYTTTESPSIILFTCVCYHLSVFVVVPKSLQDEFLGEYAAIGATIAVFGGPDW